MSMFSHGTTSSQISGRKPPSVLEILTTVSEVKRQAFLKIVLTERIEFYFFLFWYTEEKYNDRLDCFVFVDEPDVYLFEKKSIKI